MEPHDVPPPPYSETDVYTGSDHSIPAQASSNNHIQRDDASNAPSSAHSNIIYTPPDTPQDSHHEFTGAEDYQTTASAQVYFDTRTAPSHIASSSLIVHPITISLDPSPADFPYPNWAASRDVSQQDWRTFINYLIPDYADKANAVLIDRKLRAAEEDGARSSASTRDATEAQLEQLRSSSQRRRFKDTVKEWDAGFFAPRGVTVKIVEKDSTGEQKARMPGEWNSSFDGGAGSSRDAPSPTAAEPPAQERGGWQSLFGRHFGMTANDRGFRFGPITIDGDRVAIGDSFEADSSGVRWHGRDISEHLPGAHDRDRNPYPPGWGRGSRWPDASDFHRGRGRGYGRGGPSGRNRSGSAHSVSSTSSSSSSSSSSTVSSIGSLPEWDDLKESQLPVVKESVQAWLARPDQPVTKAEVKRAKAEIKAAKSLPQPTTADVGRREEIKVLLSMFDDLKRNQRATLRAAKRERRAQKKAERRARRSRNRGERNEERRQRREHRRAEREHGRHHRRRGGAPDPVPAGPHGAAQQSWPAFPFPTPSSFPGFSNPVPPVLPGPPGRAVPGVPPVPGAPPVPPVPQGGPGAFFGPGRAGWPGFGFPFGGGRGGFDPWSQHTPPTAEQSQAAQARDQAYQARKAAAKQREEAAKQREEAAKVREAAHKQAEQIRAQAAQTRTQAAVQRGLAQAQAALSKAQAKQAKAQAKAEAKQQKAQAKEQAKKQTAQLAAQERYTKKHREVEQLEQRIQEKRAVLEALQRSIEAEGIAAAQAGRGDQKRTEQSQTELDAEAVETDIGELGQRIEELMIEADEELAKTLEEEEVQKDESKVRWLN